MINAIRTRTPQQSVGSAYGNRSKNQTPLKTPPNCSEGFASPPIRVPPKIPRFRKNENQANAAACDFDVLFSPIIERIALLEVSLVDIMVFEVNTRLNQRIFLQHIERQSSAKEID